MVGRDPRRIWNCSYLYLRAGCGRNPVFYKPLDFVRVSIPETTPNGAPFTPYFGTTPLPINGFPFTTTISATSDVYGSWCVLGFTKIPSTLHRSGSVLSHLLFGCPGNNDRLFKFAGARIRIHWIFKVRSLLCWVIRTARGRLRCTAAPVPIKS